MAKKQFKKVLSMGLSLVMCASLTVPAFAASFADLNNAIDGNNDTDVNKFSDNGKDYYGYGRNEENTGWDIWAWDEDGTRNIQLHGSVEYKNSDGTQSDAKIDAGQKVVLDLNGQEVNNSAYVGSETAQEKHDDNSSVIHVRGGELTVKDSSGTDAGKITGAQQSGVWVEQSGKFTLKGGTITGNKNVNSGESAGGGGVRVNGGEFTMTGGKIIGNGASANGGGVAVVNGGKFTMEGGEISGNRSDWGGGVAVIGSGSSFTMRKDARLENNELYNENGSWGNNIPSDAYVKGGATVDASEMENFGFKVQDKGMNGADSWNDVEETTTSRGSEDSEVVLRSVYTEPDNSEEPEESENPGDGTDDETGDGTDDETGDGTDDETGDGTVIEDPAVPLDDEPEVEIEDPAVPLASGPITRAEFIDYLWRHEGEPASAGVCTFTDVEDTHQFFEALCWADENGVAEAYFNAPGHEDGTFEPDELVTVGAVREFLTNFENVFGRQAVAAASLKSLTGADDEAVLNCDEVLAEFFVAKENDVEIAA